MVSWATVEADSLDEAMALEWERFADEQEIADGSDWETTITEIESDEADVVIELRAMVAKAYREKGLNAYRCVPGFDGLSVSGLLNELDIARQGITTGGEQ